MADRKELNAAKKERATKRTAFTKAANDLSAFLDVETSSSEELNIALNLLQEKYERLAESDDKVLGLVLNRPDEEYEIEYNEVEEYRDRFRILHTKTNMKLNSSGDDRAGSNGDKQRRYKLEKLQLRKFDGNPRNWLNFWSQFSRIDSDDDMDESDKFQYLIQSTEPGSLAREIVESFPATKDNYTKAVKRLSERFGQKDMLVEIYVREMLNLVLNHDNNNIASLYDKLETQLQSLESLGVTADTYAAILYPMVESCLPQEILRVWERSRTSGSSCQESLETLMVFLKREVEGDDRIRLARSFDSSLQVKSPNSGSDKSDKSRDKKNRFNVAANQRSTVAGFMNTGKGMNTSPKVTEKRCIFCSATSHESPNCIVAQKWSLDERFKCVKDKRSCFVCLLPGHVVANCHKGKYLKCLICNRAHWPILCPKINDHNDCATSKDYNKPTTSECLSNLGYSSSVALQTLRVIAFGKTKREIRAVIDTGSQRSYILRSTAKELGLEECGAEQVTHGLFGGVVSGSQNHRVYKVEIGKLGGGYQCSFEALDQVVICGQIKTVDKALLRGFSRVGVSLTDVGTSKKIEVLLGADIAGRLMTGKIHDFRNGLVAIETKLGWTTMGKVPDQLQMGSGGNQVSSMLCMTSKLWDLESIGISDPVDEADKTKKDEEMMQEFRSTMKKDLEGRYQVDLPLTQGYEQLPTNFDVAQARLNTTTRKLLNEGRLNQYDKVFKDWEDEDIIEEVHDASIQGHYLPHRGVVKESSSTTKLRPVFDASCCKTNQRSLNHCLERGVNLIKLLHSILIRFRLRRYGVSADIRKAFLQISINPKHRDFLRFLWWTDEERKQLKTLRHRRLVFGLTCSPFILAAVLLELFESVPCDSELRQTADILRDSFYVDNCLHSVDTAEEVTRFREVAQEILLQGKFDLQEWESNSNGNEERSAPVLGMRWYLPEDTLGYCLDKFQEYQVEEVTKRSLLSVAQRIFDPCGYLSPFTLFPKILLQQAWKLEGRWDDALPGVIADPFNKWLKQVSELRNVRIPRHVGLVGDLENTSLCMFSDASEHAYAACAYLRVFFPDRSEASANLIMAKSRVAPMKVLTIPRLELMGCVVASRLAQYIKESLGVGNMKTIFWTDSSTAVWWIKTPGPWSVFVENRVKGILEISQREDWRHIPGQMNPADLPSRGSSVEQLKQSEFLNTPSWLRGREDSWPISKVTVDFEEANQEKRATRVLAGVNLEDTSSDDSLEWVKKISRFPKIVRTGAWMLRFVANCKAKSSGRPVTRGNLTSEEMRKSENQMWKSVQENCLDEKDLSNLRIIQDEDGLKLIETRLLLSDDTQEFKTPILLPSKHHLVEVLVQHTHRLLMHAGVTMVLGNLREQYWILKGRRTVKSILDGCLRCRRFRVKHMDEISPPLPSNRVNLVRIFQVVGVDLAGPLFLRDLPRGRKPQINQENNKKAWILVIVCSVYRAIHLELLTSMSTESFVLGFRRFIARRGRPSVVYSDNGTNFIGANNLFARINWNEVTSQFGVGIHRMKWIFNPPTASWWGGQFERMIRTLKDLLRKDLAQSFLTPEEMYSVLCSCEAIVNSRPITYMSENLEEPIPISPASFLVEGSSSFPESELIDQQSLSKRMRHRQAVLESLKSRFRREYLGQLGNLEKREPTKPVTVGEVVLMGSDDKKRNDWPMGVVINVFPGKDGRIRCVEVKTKTGCFIRPIQRLYSMGIQSDYLMTSRDSGSSAGDHGEEELVKDSGSTEIEGSVEGSEDIAKDTVPRQELGSGDIGVQTRTRKIRPPKRLDL